jgi:DNA-binding transcriptional regulator YdaS (Cro superfamily)
VWQDRRHRESKSALAVIVCARQNGLTMGSVKMLHTAIDAPTPETSFRLLLQSELARRCSRNPQYSLRSFAHQLGVDPSTLSQWLRHRRALTSRVIETIGQQLGLSTERVRAYIDFEMRCPSPNAAQADQLTPDTVAALEHPYAFAILELIHVADFTPDSRWIAERLGLDVDTTNVMLHRLVSLGLLRMQSRNVWVDCIPNAVGALDELTETQAFELHQHAGAGWGRAIGSAPSRARALSSTTVAVHSSALPRAIDLIARCRQQLLDMLQEDTADEVYQLEIALFPITALNSRQQADAEGTTT